MPGGPPGFQSWGYQGPHPGYRGQVCPAAGTGHNSRAFTLPQRKLYDKGDVNYFIVYSLLLLPVPVAVALYRSKILVLYLTCKLISSIKTRTVNISYATLVGKLVNRVRTYTSSLYT
jgi:hypothetical protein